MAGSKTSPARTFGKAVGSAFHARLADVWAARNVAELPLWFPLFDKPKRFVIPLTEGFVMVFESNHAADREATLGTSTDWRQVTRIHLLEVKFNG